MMKTTEQKIMPCLWFDNQAKEAANFYTSIFSHSRIGHIALYGKEGQEEHGGQEGQVLTVEFYIEDYKMLGLNGGPVFKANPSVSFFVMCDTEAEEVQLWKKISEEGQILMPLDKYDWSKKYGWVQDQFGISWQLMLREGDMTTQKISPSLLFMGPQRGHAEDAMHFYADIFEHSNIEGIKKYGKDEVAPEGFLKHAQFQLMGQNLMVMDAGQDGEFRFNEALSLMILCEDQKEVDYYWDKLSEGGDPAAQQCGWLKDKFGLSWQVVPKELMDMMKSEQQEKKDRVMQAYMQMKKFDIADLKKAFKG